MKIEIAESLILSWLRHTKNCQLVQLNWKPSVGTWDLENENILETIMKDTDQYFSMKYGLDLFKKNSSISQLLQQGEIDALGLELKNGAVRNIYGIDVAFHESGLNYGSKEESISRIIKKMVRTAMILHGYFNMRTGEIIFASPKINDSISVPLQKCVDELNVLLRQWGFSFRFHLICNGDFRDKVFNVVTSLSKSVADTSELFMRSIQMYNLFTSETVRQESKQQKKRGKAGSSDFKVFEEMKIGELVRSSFTRLAANNLLDYKEVEYLTQAEYSKTIFNVNHPVLKEYNEEIPLTKQRMDSKGYPRYYKDLYLIIGKQYLLCNHWVEDLSMSYFIAWLNDIDNSSL
jgi:hypothetical protein